MHGLRSSLYLDVAGKSPDLGGARSIHAETGRHPVLGPDCSGRPDDLYGWTSSPAGLCAAHVCRFLDRQVRRQHLDRDHNAHQTRLAPREWRAAKRRRYGHRTPYSARRYCHDSRCGERSGLLERTNEQDFGALPPAHSAGRLAIRLRRQRTNRWQKERLCPESLVRAEPFRSRVRGKKQGSAAGVFWRP